MNRFAIVLPLLFLGACTPIKSGDSMHGAARQSRIEMLRGTYRATISTTKGDIGVSLDADKAPKAVTNFVQLTKSGFYDNLIFHRVTPDFMIQGGDPRGNGTGGASIFGKPFEDEKSGIPMERGVIAMANRGPNTNLSQFFIIQGENGAPWLEGKHTTFGRVTSGMDVVDAIANASRDKKNKPNTAIPFKITIE